MKKLYLLLLSGAMLGAAACVDNAYDLTKIETGDVTIGDDKSEFKIPLVKILVPMNDLASGGANIREIFREADIWLPSTLPNGDPYVDMRQLCDNTAGYAYSVLALLVQQLEVDDDKLGEIATLLGNKYIDWFTATLPGVTSATFVGVFTDAFRHDPAIRLQLTDTLLLLAHEYLTGISIDPISYDLEEVNLDAGVVDMLADNLDPEGMANAKKTLSIRGTVTNNLPITMTLAALIEQTGTTMEVTANAATQGNQMTQPRLTADALRQIIDGVTITAPCTIERYYPGANNFNPSLQHQITIELHLVKRGGLKLDI